MCLLGGGGYKAAEFDSENEGFVASSYGGGYGGGKAQCGSNLLIGCAPSIAKVPCQPAKISYGGGYGGQQGGYRAQSYQSYMVGDTQHKEEEKPEEKGNLPVQPAHLNPNSTPLAGQNQPQKTNMNNQLNPNSPSPSNKTKREETFQAMQQMIAEAEQKS